MIRFKVEVIISPFHKNRAMCIAATVKDKKSKTYHAAFECYGERDELEELATEFENALNKIAKGICDHERA